MPAPNRVLLKHVGNMGDHLFLVGALLDGIARVWPDAQVSLATAWGYKDRRGQWGKRNQDGYCIALMKEHPRVDQLIHWSDMGVSLDARICREEGRAFPTWNRAYFERARREYDVAVELDFGLDAEENPLRRFAAAVGLPHLALGPYRVGLSAADREAGGALAARFPRPRVVLLEGLAGTTMRGWDPAKARALFERLRGERGITPLWWGSAFPPLYHGRKLRLREHIAFLAECDLAIGVLGAPMHFAAAAGVQTICLYGAQSYQRVAPAAFFNSSLDDARRHHVTIFGPTCDEPCLLKRALPCKNIRGEARHTTGFRDWARPGRQEDKSCLATIPVDTVFAAAVDALARRGLLRKAIS